MRGSSGVSVQGWCPDCRCLVCPGQLPAALINAGTAEQAAAQLCSRCQCEGMHGGNLFFFYPILMRRLRRAAERMSQPGPVVLPEFIPFAVRI